MSGQSHSPGSLHYRDRPAFRINVDEFEKALRKATKSIISLGQRLSEWSHKLRGGTVRVVVVTTQSGETREVRQLLGGYRPQRRMGGHTFIASTRGSAAGREPPQAAKSAAGQGSEKRQRGSR